MRWRKSSIKSTLPSLHLTESFWDLVTTSASKSLLAATGHLTGLLSLQYFVLWLLVTDSVNRIAILPWPGWLASEPCEQLQSLSVCGSMMPSFSGLYIGGRDKLLQLWSISLPNSTAWENQWRCLTEELRNNAHLRRLSQMRTQH